MKQKSKKKSGHLTYSDQIKHLTQIGVALSGEKNVGRLLEMILDEARKLTNANAGTIYIMSDDETELLFAIIQNDSLNVHMGGTGRKIIWSPVKLKNADGSPNHSNVSADVAISGEAVNIADVYDAQGFNFEGTKKFDEKSRYRSKSMLVVPLRNHENDIIGVLQLLNAQDQVTGDVISFSLESQELTLSLASQAAVVLTNNQLIHELKSLLESFIKIIATAIDEKSHYTGGHIRRVAQLTMVIANKINETKQAPFATVKFSADQLQELHMAAWLHDIGKITTPEHIVDKSTKLEKVYDRINDIKTRIEVLKRDYQLVTTAAAKNKSRKSSKIKSIREEMKVLDEDYRFLKKVNNSKEYTKDEVIERIKKIAKRKWKVNGKALPLLSEDEIYNLSVRHGTLNEEERNIVNNHASITQKMLSQLPFPKKMRRIASYASAHHEKIDGTGYPIGLKGDKLPLQSRIIALADIFEALIAEDRPYKKGKSLAETLKIMESMAKNNHIDADLFALFIKEKIYRDYARRELAPQQIDV